MTTGPQYLAGYCASLPAPVLERWLASLKPEQVRALRYDWRFWARPKQLAPAGDWRIWLLLAGRGYGKTKVITEWARSQANKMPGSRGAIVASTAADTRDVLIEGESGLLNVCPPWNRPTYEPSKRRLTWKNGTIATLFSADEPRRLRGPQFHWAIADELAHWRFIEAWDMLLMSLRLGTNPRCAVATTPRPIPIIKTMLVDPTVHVTRGNTYENRANLAEAFFTQIVRRYEGTRLGQQEIGGEVLDDNPAALWKRSDIEANRVTKPLELERIAVAVDPPATSTGDECGIIVSGVARQDGEWHLYTLDDRSRQGSPAEWAGEVIATYHKWKANLIVAESNQGGEMVSHTLRTMEGGKDVPIKLVHASQGKRARAEPVSALYAQGRGHHVGSFALLEDELCQWDGTGASPNRLDALVWGATELIIRHERFGGTLGVAVSRGRRW